VGLALALAACSAPVQGPAGPKGPTGSDGDTGPQGASGEAGHASLTTTTDLPRGDADCPYGGVRYDSVIDNGDGGGTADDGVLQPGEVDTTSTACDGPSSFDYGIDAPQEPVGTHVIDLHGGDGGDAGGRGGVLRATIPNGTGGNLAVVANGAPDTAFTLPGLDHVDLGSHPLDVPAGTTLTPEVIVAGGESGLAVGDVFRYRDNGDGVPQSEDSDEQLYEWTSGGRSAYTGVRVEQGATLVVPATYSPSYGTNSRLTVVSDIDNAGVIESALSGNHRYTLYLWVQHYYGEQGSRIDLEGRDASNSQPYGGEGGALFLRAIRYPLGKSPDCETSAFGGIYNQGAVDTRPGGVGANSYGQAGRQASLCASDEIYNTGPILTGGSTASVQSGAGGPILLRAMTGPLYNSGTLDARGGDGGEMAGSGGQVTLMGRGVVNSGSIVAPGGAIGPGRECVDLCAGGVGGVVDFESRGGGIRNDGSIDSAGGAAVGDTGTVRGGHGGTLSVYAHEGTDGVSGYRPPGSIEWTGDVQLFGGATDPQLQQVGGDGGEASFQLELGTASPDEVQGQAITLYGYPSIDAEGGAGRNGGDAGGMILQQLGGSSPTYAGVVYTETNFAASGGPGVAPTSADISYGGNGGGLSLQAVVSSSPAARAVNRGEVVAEGGPGTQGGESGIATLRSTVGVESSGALDLVGGAGDASSGVGGPANQGCATLGADLGPVSIGQPITCTGGDGASAGSGGLVNVWGTEVDVAADVDTSGGTGFASPGGSGNAILVYSLQTFTVVTGQLTANGGPGSPPGGPGAIVIDGQNWQEGMGGDR